MAACGFEDYPKWSPAKEVTIMKRNAGGLGVLVELTMGIFGMKTSNVMKYHYNRPVPTPPPPSLLLPLPVSLLYTHSLPTRCGETVWRERCRRGGGAPPRPPLPPVLTGHVSSLLPY